MSEERYRSGEPSESSIAPLQIEEPRAHGGEEAGLPAAVLESESHRWTESVAWGENVPGDGSRAGAASGARTKPDLVALGREVRAFLRDLALTVLIAIVIVAFVIQPVRVEGTSMLPRLHDGERIFVNKFIYKFEPIRRGDIVVFWYPNDPSKSFIKRVIGLPGEMISIRRGIVYINGEPLPEPYLDPSLHTREENMPPVYVREHYYFVMGDNRDSSNDSRQWGLVPEKYIYGKAVFRYWPLSNIGRLR
jgi:signal peptidase I